MHEQQSGCRCVQASLGSLATPAIQAFLHLLPVVCALWILSLQV